MTQHSTYGRGRQRQSDHGREEHRDWDDYDRGRRSKDSRTRYRSEGNDRAWNGDDGPRAPHYGGDYGREERDWDDDDTSFGFSSDRSRYDYRDRSERDDDGDRYESGRGRQQRYGRRSGSSAREPGSRYPGIGRRRSPSYARDHEDSGEEEPHYRGVYRRSSTPYRYAGGSGYLVSESFTLTGPYTGRGPKGYQRKDEQICEEANQRLERHGHVDASDIEVSCQEGVLTLKGKVEDRRSKREAEDCVEDIYGVKDVMNELRVDKGFFAKLFGSSDDHESRTEGSKSKSRS